MITAILIGAGQRGKDIYGTFALDNPDKIKFIACAEPNKTRRETFAKEHNIEPQMLFNSWEEILDKSKLADAAFICTQDRMHKEPVVKALELGYHVLTEKPMSPEPSEIMAMGEAAKASGKILSVAHVLRYSDFFSKIKEIIDSKALGEILNIDHIENVGYWHQAHSFVRGNWRRADETSPMILQKCCHDMDLIAWMIGTPCISIDSFGKLSHFKKENAPKGASKRCMDCKVSESCPYDAKKLYLGENIAWPVSVISEDHSLEARTKALETGPYGRCVYDCDNDVVDHQICAMEFEGGATATLTMCAFTYDTSRSIRIMGTRGELSGKTDSSSFNELYLHDFVTDKTEVIRVSAGGIMTGHEGWDVKYTESFINQVESGDIIGKTSADVSIASHLMCLAAEKSRVEGKRVFMEELYSATVL